MNANDRVTGTYYGKKFTGTITECRPDYSGFRGRETATIYTIKCDAPIQTPSDVRDVIMIITNGSVGDVEFGITANTTIRPEG